MIAEKEKRPYIFRYKERTYPTGAVYQSVDGGKFWFRVWTKKQIDAKEIRRLNSQRKAHRV